jgi:tRNA pseudouridine38-40 synthase
VTLEGSGRTDAGVHALAQVATFRLRHKMTPGKLLLALNAVIPKDIAVLEATEVPPDFHARFSAIAKTYRYTILNGRVRRPLILDQVYHFPQPIASERMHEAAQALVGTHDFRAFAKEADRKRSCVRTIFRVAVEREDDLIRIEVTGSGFLYNMIRIIVGTLIDVGLGRRPVSSVASLVKGGKRPHAGFTVPASGLCLVGVEYR